MEVTARPYLTPEEIDEICKPLTQPAAQVRFMTQVLGLKVERKPGGEPLVWRVHLEAVKGPGYTAGKSAPPALPSALTEPNMGALQARIAAKQAHRKHRHGTTTQGR